jgi:hypothetical protein
VAAASAAAPAEPVASDSDEGPEEHDNHEDDFGSKAFIVGNDHPALRQAAKLTGFLPVHYPTAEQARERYMQEPPQLVIINPPQLTPPPLESMQPIISLTPGDRRKSFFILVAPKDLGNFPQIYKEAHTFHERLYASMTATLKAQQGA